MLFRSGKASDAGRDWGQEEKGTTEDEIAGWHHLLNGHEFELELAIVSWKQPQLVTAGRGEGPWREAWVLGSCDTQRSICAGPQSWAPGNRVKETRAPRARAVRESPGSSAQTHVHRVGDAIQLSHPLSSPFPPAPNPSQHQSLFQGARPGSRVTGGD